MLRLKTSIISLVLLLAVSILGCSKAEKVSNEDGLNFLTAYEPVHADGDVNVVIEIPAGTLEKWEVSKPDGQLTLEQINGKPRIVEYVGYPGNYGMIPRTLLPKSQGGDGDPLDVLVLGAPVPRGTVVKAKVIGVLRLLDRGEQDDKLIAIQAGSPLDKVESLEQLQAEYKGITDIIEIWFNNYKGPGMLESKGFSNKEKANIILQSSITAYQKAASN